jgi:hypothetical protein
MLPGLAVAPHSVLNTRSTLFQVIHGLGLNANLKLCLDAGDRGSVASGSQTKWLDVSGNGYDFNRGTTTSSESSDPTFNGTVGAQSSSEFYSFDGGDFFTYDTTLETWMQNIHKNNAATTICAWVNNSIIPILSDRGGSGVGAIGFTYWNGNGESTLLVTHSSGNAFSRTWAHGVSASWQFVAASINEASNSLVLMSNDAENSGTCTYSSPSSSSASGGMNIGTVDGSVDNAQSGSRVACLAAFDTPLSLASLRLIRQATRGKFGV